MKEELIKELAKLNEAWSNINKFWIKGDSMCDEILPHDYPFHKCFNELNADVKDWVEGTTSRLLEYGEYDSDILQEAWSKMDKFMPSDEELQNEYHLIMEEKLWNRNAKSLAIENYIENNVNDEERMNSYLKGQTIIQFAKFLVDTYC